MSMAGLGDMNFTNKEKKETKKKKKKKSHASLDNYQFENRLYILFLFILPIKF